MGCCCCCFPLLATTSSDSTTSSPTAIVIAADGCLKEYSVPITVSKVLGIDHLSCFLCNADALSFDAFIPPLHYNDYLEEDQIYFVLPKSKIGVPLKGADMAALAVKTSLALEVSSQLNKDMKSRQIGGGGGGGSLIRMKESSGGEERGGDPTIGRLPARQPSMRERVGRNASSWAKVLRNSLKRTLSRIEEVDAE